MQETKPIMDDDDANLRREFFERKPGVTDAQMRRKMDRRLGELNRELGHTLVRRQRKIGRNDPCPCNSGRKFKKCCIPTLEGRNNA